MSITLHTLESPWIWSWGPVIANSWNVFAADWSWYLLWARGLLLRGWALCLPMLAGSVDSSTFFSHTGLLFCLYSLVSSSLILSHGTFTLYLLVYLPNVHKIGRADLGCSQGPGTQFGCPTGGTGGTSWAMGCCSHCKNAFWFVWVLISSAPV